MTIGSWVFITSLILIVKHARVVSYNTNNHNNVTGVQSSVERFVANGVPYNKKKYAFVLSFVADKSVCSATLVKPLFAVTAAHCTWNLEAGKSNVYRGHYDQAAKDDTIRRKVVHYYQHEQFDINKNPFPDISIIQIESEYAEIEEYAEIGGNPGDFKNGKLVKCIGVGFGKTEYQKLAKKNGYQYAVSMRYGPDACIGDTADPKQWVNYLCSKPSIKQACFGDSGGPTFCKGKFYAIYMSRYNYVIKDPQIDFCGDPNIETKHLFLFQYRNWIAGIVGPLPSSESGDNSREYYDDEFASGSIPFNKRALMLLNSIVLCVVLF
ncbi:snake venom serine proteinase 2-like [Adelges cooleyi]|uniref:snake venom serine proteinase 2-like n=1 Tax=Adelges cooleyi TaxID=133065 RepID=UPI0021803E3D|nr:snake venom serine proteinase 2-like [Adelges cooleyi]